MPFGDTLVVDKLEGPPLPSTLSFSSLKVKNLSVVLLNITSKIFNKNYKCLPEYWSVMDLAFSSTEIVLHVKFMKLRRVIREVNFPVGKCNDRNTK